MEKSVVESDDQKGDNSESNGKNDQIISSKSNIDSSVASCKNTNVQVERTNKLKDKAESGNSSLMKGAGSSKSPEVDPSSGPSQELKLEMNKQVKLTPASNQELAKSHLNQVKIKIDGKKVKAVGKKVNIYGKKVNIGGKKVNINTDVKQAKRNIDLLQIKRQGDQYPDKSITVPNKTKFKADTSQGALQSVASKVVMTEDIQPKLRMGDQSPSKFNQVKGKGVHYSDKTITTPNKTKSRPDPSQGTLQSVASKVVMAEDNQSKAMGGQSTSNLKQDENYVKTKLDFTKPMSFHAKAIAYEAATKSKVETVLKGSGKPKKKFYFLFRVKEFNVMNKKDDLMYKCHVCNGTYKQKFSLKRHFLRNHINPKFISFSDISNCKINVPNEIMQQFAEETKLPSGRKRFKTKDAIFLEGNKSRLMPGLYRCHECSHIRLDLESELKAHYVSHPNVQPDENFPCEFCTAVFQKRAVLNRHLAAHHDKKNPNICQKCRQGFTNDLEFQKHLSAQGSVGKCKYCEKEFCTTAERKKHEHLHEGKKIYSCKHCHEVFSNIDDVKGHVVKMHSSLYLTCPYCPKQAFPHMFATKLLLSAHVREKHDVVSGKKPALAVSTVYSNKNSNGKISTAAESVCNYCQKKFPGVRAMLKHKAIAHKRLLNKHKNATQKKNALAKKQSTMAAKQKAYNKKMANEKKIQQKNMVLHKERTTYERKAKQAVQDKLVIERFSTRRMRFESSRISMNKFYANLAQNIAENLLEHVDGRAHQLSIKNYNFNDNNEHFDNGSRHDHDKIPWSSYNFPIDFDVQLALEKKGQEIKPKVPDDELCLYATGLGKVSSASSDEDTDNSVSTPALKNVTGDKTYNAAALCALSLEEKKKLLQYEPIIVFICCVCKQKYNSFQEIDDHTHNNHPNVQPSWIEVEGTPDTPPLVPLDLCREPYANPDGVLFSCTVPPLMPNICTLKCTKCYRIFPKSAELHQHLLECGGNELFRPKYRKKPNFQKRIKHTMKHRMDLSVKQVASKKESPYKDFRNGRNEKTKIKYGKDYFSTKTGKHVRAQSPLAFQQKNITCFFCKEKFDSKLLLTEHYSVCSKFNRKRKRKTASPTAKKNQTSDVNKQTGEAKAEMVNKNSKSNLQASSEKGLDLTMVTQTKLLAENSTYDSDASKSGSTLPDIILSSNKSDKLSKPTVKESSAMDLSVKTVRQIVVTKLTVPSNLVKGKPVSSSNIKKTPIEALHETVQRIEANGTQKDNSSLNISRSPLQRSKKTSEVVVNRGLVPPKPKLIAPKPIVPNTQQNLPKIKEVINEIKLAASNSPNLKKSATPLMFIVSSTDVQNGPVRNINSAISAIKTNLNDQISSEPSSKLNELPSVVRRKRKKEQPTKVVQKAIDTAIEVSELDSQKAILPVSQNKGDSSTKTSTDTSTICTQSKDMNESDKVIKNLVGETELLPINITDIQTKKSPIKSTLIQPSTLPIRVPSSAVNSVAASSSAVNSVAAPSSAVTSVAAPSSAVNSVAAPSSAVNSVAAPSSAVNSFAAPSSAVNSAAAPTLVSAEMNQDQVTDLFISNEKTDVKCNQSEDRDSPTFELLVSSVTQNIENFDKPSFLDDDKFVLPSLNISSMVPIRNDKAIEATRNSLNFRVIIPDVESQTSSLLESDDQQVSEINSGIRPNLPTIVARVPESECQNKSDQGVSVSTSDKLTDFSITEKSKDIETTHIKDKQNNSPVTDSVTDESNISSTENLSTLHTLPSKLQDIILPDKDSLSSGGLNNQLGDYATCEVKNNNSTSPAENKSTLDSASVPNSSETIQLSTATTNKPNDEHVSEQQSALNKEQVNVDNSATSPNASDDVISKQPNVPDLEPFDSIEETFAAVLKGGSWRRGRRPPGRPPGRPRGGRRSAYSKTSNDFEELNLPANTISSPTKPTKSKNPKIKPTLSSTKVSSQLRAFRVENSDLSNKTLSETLSAKSDHSNSSEVSSNFGKDLASRMKARMRLSIRTTPESGNESRLESSKSHDSQRDSSTPGLPEGNLNGSLDSPLYNLASEQNVDDCLDTVTSIKKEFKETELSKKHICPFCILEFAYLTNFRRHLKICKSKYDNLTVETPASTTSNSQIQHLPKKDEVEESMLNLFRHQSRQNQMIKETQPVKTCDLEKKFQKFICEDCHKIYFSLFKLMQHRMKEHLMPSAESKATENQSAPEFDEESQYLADSSVKDDVETENTSNLPVEGVCSGPLLADSRQEPTAIASEGKSEKDQINCLNKEENVAKEDQNNLLNEDMQVSSPATDTVGDATLDDLATEAKGNESKTENESEESEATTVSELSSSSNKHSNDGSKKSGKGKSRFLQKKYKELIDPNYFAIPFGRGRGRKKKSLVNTVEENIIEGADKVEGSDNENKSTAQKIEVKSNEKTGVNNSPQGSGTNELRGRKKKSLVNTVEENIIEEADKVEASDNENISTAQMIEVKSNEKTDVNNSPQGSGTNELQSRRDIYLQILGNCSKLSIVKNVPSNDNSKLKVSSQNEKFKNNTLESSVGIQSIIPNTSSTAKKRGRPRFSNNISVAEKKEMSRVRLLDMNDSVDVYTVSSQKDSKEITVVKETNYQSPPFLTVGSPKKPGRKRAVAESSPIVNSPKLKRGKYIRIKKEIPSPDTSEIETDDSASFIVSGNDVIPSPSQITKFQTSKSRIVAKSLDIPRGKELKGKQSAIHTFLPASSKNKVTKASKSLKTVSLSVAGHAVESSPISNSAHSKSKAVKRNMKTSCDNKPGSSIIVPKGMPKNTKALKMHLTSGPNDASDFPTVSFRKRVRDAICPICKKRFSAPLLRNRHVQMAHGRKNSRVDNTETISAMPEEEEQQLSQQFIATEIRPKFQRHCIKPLPPMKRKYEKTISSIARFKKQKLK